MRMTARQLERVRAATARHFGPDARLWPISPRAPGMTAKLKAALAECRPRAATLAGGMREAALLRPVTAERAPSPDDPRRFRPR
jgi:hypothetical protein